MQAVRIETIVAENGEVHLSKLPFKTGESVEIIVLQRAVNNVPTKSFPLRGVPIVYDSPTDAVANGDWSAQQ